MHSVSASAIAWERQRAGQAAARFRSDRRKALRARMEARVEATDGNRPQQAPDSRVAEVIDLQDVRHAAQLRVSSQGQRRH